MTYDYDRQRAVAYANHWWYQPNPAFPYFQGDDCSNFISQCLLAGGAPMQKSSDRYKGWWIHDPAANSAKWSVSWAVAHSLHWFLRTNTNGLRATLVSSADQLQLGDVIQYDWQGDGRINHSALVSGFSTLKKPLVNAHTRPVYQREWSYRDSHAWTKQTVYYFLRIADQF